MGCASALIPQQLRFSASSVTMWCRKKEKITPNSKEPEESVGTQLSFFASSDTLQKSEKVKTPTLSSVEAFCEMGRRFRFAHRLDPAPATQASTDGAVFTADQNARDFPGLECAPSQQDCLPWGPPPCRYESLGAPAQQDCLPWGSPPCKYESLGCSLCG